MTKSSGHERYGIPHADVLFTDTWGEDAVCPNCGALVESEMTQCPTCKQWLGECGRSCPGCPSPRCVGGLRESKNKEGR